MNDSDLEQILQFSHLLFQLKTIIRFKGMPFWENSSFDRWDSTAEHTYRMAMLALLLARRSKQSLNIERLLKMILIHDCVEIFTGDEFPFQQSGNEYINKVNLSQERQEKDRKAFQELKRRLPQDLGNEFVELFLDFLSAQSGNADASSEAKFATALDRIESTLQVIEYRKQESNWSGEHKKLQLEYMKSRIFSDNDVLEKFSKLIEKEAEDVI